MKVFWSWQSDTPGRTGRHLVRDCLQAAIDALNRERAEASEIEEPAVRDTMELDHDRKGVKGSPGLADTIYAKIREAAVVVCDVTPVAELIAGDGRTKKVTNPNVAIELGYAQGTRGDDRVLMVLNLAHGRHEDLAFDLRHKTGILAYSLPGDAESADITAEKKRFTALLVDALRPYAEEPAEPAAAPAPFVRAASTSDSARWWAPGEVLGHHRGGTDLVGPTGPLLYLRLMPTRAVPAIAGPDLRDHASRFTTFEGGFNLERNRYGIVLLRHVGGEDGDPVEVWAATQLFETGEVWAVDAYHLRDERGRGPGWPYVPIGAVERQTYRMLRQTVGSMVEIFGTPLPIAMEFGMAPAVGFRLPLGNQNWSGECFDAAIRIEAQLIGLDDATIAAQTASLFVQFWGRFGEHRPADMPIGGWP